ncbi:MAG TPA: FecR domain-containing protein [Novosphingobium sp.]
MARIKTPRAFLIGAAALAIAAPAAVWAAPTQVGIASAVVNNVQVRSGGAPQAHAARIRERLSLADQVSTGARSRLQILLLDRSTFTVGADARLTIDRFVYDPAGSSVSASVAKGAFRFLSGGRGHRGGGSSIKTPVATIGIRGTIVDGTVGPEAVAIARGEGKVTRGMTVDPQTATLVVLRGPGARTGGKVGVGAISVTAGGVTVDCERPLLAVFVPAPGAAPIGPFTISLPGLAQLNDLIVPSGEPILSGDGGSAYPVPEPARRPPPRYGRYPGDAYPGDGYPGGPEGPDIGGPEPGGRYMPTMPGFPQGGDRRRPPTRQTAPAREAAPVQRSGPVQETPAQSPARDPQSAPVEQPASAGQSTPMEQPAQDPTVNAEPTPNQAPAIEPQSSPPAQEQRAAPTNLKSQSISSTPGKP